MYTFKQSNRNAVLHLIGHRKRISLETNLASENEPAIFSKGGQFRLSTRKTLPFLGMKTKMNESEPPHGDPGQREFWNGAEISNRELRNSRVSYSRLPWAEQRT